MAIRNWMFDIGVLRSQRFDVPTICVGNLAVGGTGKTPHTEHILRLLKSEGLHAGMLSRGYRRKTRGFLEVKGEQSHIAVESSANDSLTLADRVGDEPLQVKRNCWWSYVCVCEDRCQGIRRMLASGNRLDAIVLDDAFQHRYVQPGLSLLLTDYSNLYFSDYVMPSGRLREGRKGARRADVVIVTKSPEHLSENEQQYIQQQLRLLPHQSLFFSRMEYGALWNPYREADILTHGTNVCAPVCDMKRMNALLVCGIARPESFVKYFEAQCASVDVLSYSDHHRFTASDISEIARKSQDVDIIITTQKDWVRLSGYDLPGVIKQKLCVQLIKVRFLNNTEKSFNQIIIDYVTKNTTNRPVD